ncbi:MAG TPA: hypothetical protein VFR85_03455 [Anaeromyxobacteraceae bacterium]|nr:hypothetical protein [Anaeromyxobacteraceae bacterium]
MTGTLQTWACLAVGVLALGGCGLQNAIDATAPTAQVAALAVDDLCYSVENLGPVYFEGFGLQALGINAPGTVAGTTLRWTGDRTGFIYRNGTLTRLGDLGGGLSDARAVNASGYAVGGSRDAAGNYRAVSFYKGEVTDLGTLDGTHSWSMDVNNSGVAVGDAMVSGRYHAAAFFMGHVIDLGTLGGDTFANGVNDAGDVVGSGQLEDGSWRGFLWRQGKMEVIGTIGGAEGSVDVAKINNRGTACGSANALNAYHGFLYRDGETIELGDLGSSAAGYGVSGCQDISETGMAVGWAADADYWDRAVVWTNPPHGLVDLNTRIPPEAGAYLFLASGVNSAGQITAYGVNTVTWDPVEGYLLSPTRCPPG